MSNVFASFPPRRFAVRVVFHSRRRHCRRDAGEWDGIILLSPAWNRHQKKCGGGNLAKESSPEAASTQKRMLKMKLKSSRWTRTARKHSLEMFHGLQQGIGMPTDRWLLLAAKPGAKVVKPLAQFAPQPIECFQGKGQPQLFDRSLERKTRQQFYQPLPHQRSRQCVARQNLRQTKHKCPSATIALTPVGTKHPLPPDGLAVGHGGIIAARMTMPVQGANAAAMGTRRLLEGKSCAFNS
jgi:hypothetical protein